MNEDSYVTLYKLHYAELLNYATRLLNNGAPAQDIVQEAFLRLWKRRQTLAHNQHIRALLFKAVRNLALNMQRDEQKRKSLLLTVNPSSNQQDPEDDAGTALLKSRIQNWISELPSRRREAFELSRFEGFSYAEIASLMDVSVKTVENHILLALRFLRNKMESYDPQLLQRP